MTEPNDDIDQQFGVGRGNPSADSDDDFEETADDYDDVVERASDLLKNTAILLQYLGDENFCKSITKRERNIIAKHVDRIYEFTDELQQLIDGGDE